MSPSHDDSEVSPPGSGPAFPHETPEAQRKLAVSKGFSAPQGDRNERRLNLEAYLAVHPDSTFYMRVSGDSMRGAGIFDGDLLVIDRSEVPKDGEVVVVATDGEFVVRRLAKDARGAPVLRAENPAYRDMPLRQAGENSVWGVVKWSVHKV